MKGLENEDKQLVFDAIEKGEPVGDRGSLERESQGGWRELWMVYRFSYTGIKSLSNRWDGLQGQSTNRSKCRACSHLLQFL